MKWALKEKELIMNEYTDHKIVAVTIPMPIQSINMKYSNNLQNEAIPNWRNTENAMDDTGTKRQG